MGKNSEKLGDDKKLVLPVFSTAERDFRAGDVLGVTPELARQIRDSQGQIAMVTLNLANGGEVEIGGKNDSRMAVGVENGENVRYVNQGAMESVGNAEGVDRKLIELVEERGEAVATVAKAIGFLRDDELMDYDQRLFDRLRYWWENPGELNGRRGVLDNTLKFLAIRNVAKERQAEIIEKIHEGLEAEFTGDWQPESMEDEKEFMNLSDVMGTANSGAPLRGLFIEKVVKMAQLMMSPMSVDLKLVIGEHEFVVEDYSKRYCVLYHNGAGRLSWRLKADPGFEVHNVYGVVTRERTGLLEKFVKRLEEQGLSLEGLAGFVDDTDSDVGAFGPNSRAGYLRMLNNPKGEMGNDGYEGDIAAYKTAPLNLANVMLFVPFEQKYKFKTEEK